MDDGRSNNLAVVVLIITSGLAQRKLHSLDAIMKHYLLVGMICTFVLVHFMWSPGEASTAYDMLRILMYDFKVH